jgi:hypothetical protein
MKRSNFIAAAASAVSISRPLLAKAEDLTKRAGISARAGIGANVEASGWGKPAWYCASDVVWLDVASGIYYYKGDRWYGRTKSGAYTCEKKAIAAGNRAETYR